MSSTALATAADYSEALGVARRAKSLIALLLLLMLVGQITFFFLARYDVIHVETVDPVAAAASTQPTQNASRLVDIIHYATGVTLLGGIGLGIVLAMVLCLIAHIMLVGRLIGVGKVTISLIWCFVLIVFLFPWQCFMNNAELTDPDFRVRGVLWTWTELTHRVHFANDFSASGWPYTILAWFRFAGAPIVAVIMTLMIQLRSNRGIRMAMGEDDILNQMLGEQPR